MSTTREDRIRARARLIWEIEGRPNGRDLEHWLLAEHLVELEEGRLGSARALADFASELAHEREKSQEADAQQG
ncbi:DUF2934 domain-containing protein [Prosthecomicrobium sp. N25]|uniref:DUF2934 domain-containing protein n=1 Tax=Prosthecomicrobium sp. N25 TaxID=3129254 RepID=UPI00307709D9